MDNILNKIVSERLLSNSSSFQPSPTTPFPPPQLAHDQGVSNTSEHVVSRQARYCLHPPAAAHNVCSNVGDVGRHENLGEVPLDETQKESIQLPPTIGQQVGQQGREPQGGERQDLHKGTNSNEYRTQEEDGPERNSSSSHEQQVQGTKEKAVQTAGRQSEGTIFNEDQSRERAIEEDSVQGNDGEAEIINITTPSRRGK